MLETSEIGGEAFTWSRARTFKFNKNSIGRATADATATRLHFSVHCTAPLARHQAGQPMFSAECLMHSAAHASQRATPRPALPCPADILGDGAHNEVDVVADGTHAASDVTAAEWLAATLAGGDVNAGGTGALTSDVDDGHFPGLEGDNSARRSSHLHTLPDNHDDLTPLLSPHNAIPGGSGGARIVSGRRY